MRQASARTEVVCVEQTHYGALLSGMTHGGFAALIMRFEFKGLPGVNYFFGSCCLTEECYQFI